MGHDTMFSLERCSLFALLVGALACGDARSMPLAPPSDSAAAPETATPAPSTHAVTEEATLPAAPAEPAPPATTPASANGAGEGAGPAPIGLEPEGTPASGGASDDPAASEPPESIDPDEPAAENPVPDEPAEEGPTSEQPAPDEPAEAEPTEEEPAEEEPTADAPAPDEPAAGSSLARGGAPTRQSALSPGPFGVTIVTTGLRDGPDYGSQTLHVPEGVAPPFAAVAIVPGRDELESSIQAWGPFLASHGIVTLTFGTNDPGDDPDVRALALLDALDTLRAENSRAGGPLEGELALDHLGVMGWSAGGAGVLRAASNTPALKAAITLAAFSPGGQFPDDQVPTLLLAGSADARAGGQSQGVFESLPDTTPRMLFEVQGGSHEVGNDPQNAEGEVGLYGLSWLEVFLVGDERYRQFLDEAPTQASDFRASLGDTP
ncbi:MAG TPA: hypothetical protein VNN80_06620 [Polyangiaceae bacterium]|nr:hypothetical protein [Polyangiaceae bacterium]